MVNLVEFVLHNADDHRNLQRTHFSKLVYVQDIYNN